MLIDYLYGQLSKTESDKVEQYLKDHPDERAKLEGLGETREILTTYPDKEVIAPTILGEYKKNIAYFFPTPYVRWTLAVAASVSLLILIAYITDLKFELSTHGISLQFGQAVETPPTALTMEQLEATITTTLEASYEKQEQLMDKFRNELKLKQAGQEERQKEDLKKWIENYLDQQRGDLKKYASVLEQDNRHTIDAYFSHTAMQQQVYMKDLLVDFINYMDEQRQQDKEFYLNRLVDLKISSDIRQQETEQILTSIINTVNSLPSETTTQNF